MNKFEIGESELSFFKGEAGYSACFTPNAISSYWWTTGRLGELILMLENVKIVHTMGHLSKSVINPKLRKKMLFIFFIYKLYFAAIL